MLDERALDESRRLEVLAALGIDVYRLRSAGPADIARESPRPEAFASLPVPARLVVASAHGAGREPRLARLLTQVLGALAVPESAVQRIETSADGSLAQLPDASAYLLIGSAAARACSAHLSIDRQNAVTLAVVDFDGSGLPLDAGAKRALWQLLKPLARRLRGD
jgi:DNA polymerase III psi subunit